MKSRLLIAALLCLSACDHLEEDGKAVGDQAKADGKQLASNTADGAEHYAAMARDNIRKTGERVRKWILQKPLDEQRQAVKASYCYQVLQDILCYRQPMPGSEYRLVGYQGTGAKSPEAAMMEPLKLRPADSGSTPASRVANAQPVFTSPPPAVKEEPKSDSATPDPTHEQLPDPALAPQL